MDLAAFIPGPLSSRRGKWRQPDANSYTIRRKNENNPSSTHNTQQLSTPLTSVSKSFVPNMLLWLLGKREKNAKKYLFVELGFQAQFSGSSVTLFSLFIHD
jgi:hypothetical protein